MRTPPVPNRILLALVVVAVAATVFPATALASLQPHVVVLPPRVPTKLSDQAHDPSTVLVRLREGASSEARSTLGREGLDLVRRVYGSTWLVAGTRGQNPKHVVARLARNADIADAQLNHIRHATRTPNDPLYGQGYQEYLKTVRLPAAWDVTTGATGVTVAILDSGVDLNHPDLAAKTVAGWDFVNGDSQAWDDNGHGTFVAGIAAAASNNSRGVVGASWGARIMPIKVLARGGGGTDDRIASGIRWAVDHGAKVVNLSLGGPGDNPVLAQAVAYAASKNALVVASAGNEGSVGAPSYPAAYPAAVAVSATDRSGGFVWWSNSGWWVDVTAPGMAMTSTCMGDGTADTYCTGGSGTSFSAPLVAGVAALIRGKYTSWSQATVAAKLRTSARDMGPRGIDPYYGWGIVDAFAAVGGAKQAPSAVPPRDGREPDGVVDVAKMVTGSGSATISPEGDVDWFKASVTVPGAVTFTVSPPSFNGSRGKEMDAVVAVYGPDLRLLAEMDQVGTGVAETVTVAAPLTGSYYLSVRNHWGSQSPGTYSVNVQSAPADVASPGFELWRWHGDSAYPVAPATADVTGDGVADLLSVEQSPATLRIRSIGADGTVKATLTRAIPAQPRGVAVGDVNGDGRADVVVPTASNVTVFYQGTAGLGSATGIGTYGGYGSPSIGDVDGNGFADIALDPAAGTPLLLLNSGTGFAPAATAPRGVAPSEVGDVSGDGIADVVAVASSNVAVSSYVGGVISTDHPVTGLNDARALAIADVTGDSAPDVAVAAGGGGGKVYVLPQVDGALGAASAYAAAGAPRHLEAADLTGDGLVDLAISHPGIGKLGFLLQRTDGTLGPQSLRVLPAGSSLLDALALGDVTADGTADLLYAKPLDAQGQEPWGLWLLPNVGNRFVTVRNTTPGDFAVGASRTGSITVRFGADVSTVSFGGVRLANGTNNSTIGRAITFDPATETLTLNPTPTLAAGTPYIVFVNGVKDPSGRPLGQFVFWFTTAA